MSNCSTCEKEIKRNDFSIWINLAKDEFYTAYVFCSDECKLKMYTEEENGVGPGDSYVERRYNE